MDAWIDYNEHIAHAPDSIARTCMYDRAISSALMQFGLALMRESCYEADSLRSALRQQSHV
jgi:hypothetical protein